jgi:hypothetical protein
MVKCDDSVTPSHKSQGDNKIQIYTLVWVWGPRHLALEKYGNSYTGHICSVAFQDNLWVQTLLKK